MNLSEFIIQLQKLEVEHGGKKMSTLYREYDADMGVHYTYEDSVGFGTILSMSEGDNIIFSLSDFEQKEYFGHNNYDEILVKDIT